jgi:hypothetical protein
MSSNNNNISNNHLTPKEKTELLNLLHAEAKKLIRARGGMITIKEAVEKVLRGTPNEFEKAIDELATTNPVLAEKLSRHDKHQPSIIVEEIDLEASALTREMMNTDPGLRKWKQDNPELAKDSDWRIKVWKRKGLLD